MFLLFFITFLFYYIIFCSIEKEFLEYKKIEKKLKFLIYLLSMIIILTINILSKNILFNYFFSLITPILISHFFIDCLYKELPDNLNLIIFILGLLCLFINFIIVEISIKNFIYYISTGLIMFFIYLIIACISGGSIGGGDIKLVGALGVFYPLSDIFKLLYYPILIGALYSIFLIITKKCDKKDVFPFGPFIIISSIFIFIF